MDRINHPTAVDIGGGRRGFRSKDTVAGLPGTVVTAGFLNAVQEEIVGVIAKSDLTPQNLDDAQLIKAVRSQRMNYALAAGTPNALTAVLSPEHGPNAALAGMPIRLLISQRNTGEATLNLNGLGALPILSAHGSYLVAGDLKPGFPADLLHMGTVYVMTGPAYGEFRQRVHGNLVVYVRPDGHDGNDGLTNAAGGAFKTLNGMARSVAQSYDTTGYTVEARLADGEYAPLFLERWNNAPLKIVGYDASPANVRINNGSSGVACITALAGSAVEVTGTRFDGNGRAIEASSGSSVNFGSVVFNTYGDAQLYATYGGTISAGGNYGISSGSGSHGRAGPGGSIILTGPRSISLAGGLAFYDGFAFANGGFIAADGLTFVGGATGPRYVANLGGLIFTAGGGANYLPGDTPGSLATGGAYV